MNTKDFFGFLWGYIKRHLALGIMLICFVLCFALVFSLYGLPPEPVRYAALLCLVFGGVFLVVDISRSFHRHEELAELRYSIKLSVDSLPEPRGIIEADYRELLRIAHQDKLSLTQDAERARRELVDYYTLWVHQIKTPIAAMRLILQTEEGAENAEIKAELFRIEQYVEMVLAYLRLDSDYSDFVIGRHDVDDIVRQALRKYASQFIRKKISLDYTPCCFFALTDEKWLLFVIEQLLSNSIKYTSDGVIRIFGDSKKKTLCIEDTGIGIEESDLPRVFDKGFTGYNGREYKRSTGIGLYLCRRTLKKLGHEIKLESQVGKGTRATLQLKSVDIILE